jgi:hypothetical protein
VSIVLQRRASIAFYEVVWSVARDDSSFEVLTNPASGAAFAYVDLGFAPEIRLSPPIVGSGAAARLAQASSYSASEAVTFPPECELGYGASGEPVFSWMVGFSDAVLKVDAVTGAVAVAKWDSSR